MPVVPLFAAIALVLAPVPDGGYSDPPPRAVAMASRWADQPRSPLPVAYDWPTGGPVEVLTPFAPPPVAWGAGHRGVDLAAAPGDPIRSAGDGVVAFAGRVADRSVVSVDHADGIRTTYEPLVPAVRTGQRVARGEVLGTLVEGHCPSGCVHVGARRGEDRYLDPLSLFAEPVIRLYR